MVFVIYSFVYFAIDIDHTVTIAIGPSISDISYEVSDPNTVLRTNTNLEEDISNSICNRFISVNRSDFISDVYPASVIDDCTAFNVKVSEVSITDLIPTEFLKEWNNSVMETKVVI